MAGSGATVRRAHVRRRGHRAGEPSTRCRGVPCHGADKLRAAADKWIAQAATRGKADMQEMSISLATVAQRRHRHCSLEVDCMVL